MAKHRGKRSKGAKRQGGGLRGLDELKGEVMNCVQYARSRSGVSRCFMFDTKAKNPVRGPHSPSVPHRRAAGVTRPYRYKTAAYRARKSVTTPMRRLHSRKQAVARAA